MKLKRRRDRNKSSEKKKEKESKSNKTIKDKQDNIKKIAEDKFNRGENNSNSNPENKWREREDKNSNI